MHRTDLDQLPGDVIRNRCWARAAAEERTMAAAAKTDFAFVIPNFSSFLRVLRNIADPGADWH
jgi:hypothetical protein